MGSLLIVKKDSLTGAPLSGVEFFVTDSDGAVVGNGNGKFTTDFAGSILISNLEPGKTVVAKETRTVSGYVLDDAPQTVKIKANETVTLEFRNAPKGALLSYAPPVARVDEPSAGYIFAWDPFGNGSWIFTDQFEGEGGTHSEYIEGLTATDMKKTCDDLACYCKSCCD